MFVVSVVAVGQGKAIGGTISVVGDLNDGAVDVNGLPQDFDRTQLRIGVAGNNVRGVAGIYFFTLPNVSAPATIVGAELEIEYLGIAQGSPGVFKTPEFNVDLFGLGVRATPTILSADYYDGETSLSTDTLIADEFVTASTAAGSVQVTGGPLLSFITSLYQPDGTPNAPFVVFRANPDADLPVFSPPYRGYELASADNTNADFVPRLNLNFVPEPGSVVLWFVGLSVFTVMGIRHSPRQANGQ